jgi:hypothetical protein
VILVKGGGSVLSSELIAAQKVRLMKVKNQQLMSQRSRYQVSGPRYSHLEQRVRQMDDERRTCLRGQSDE